MNNAVQTDSEGKTVPAPGTTGTGESGGSSEPGPAPDESGGASAGNAAIGKTVFEATCQGCHTAGGTVAGVGPKLTLSKLDSAAIRAQIVDGKGFMPGGLVSGDDLANVVAFVDSIKK
ncbi:MAG: cytochrome c [Thermoleophilia bacterium]|nr:cytochrome c [Thermoleophilia bacterium]